MSVVRRGVELSVRGTDRDGSLVPHSCYCENRPYSTTVSLGFDHFSFLDPFGYWEKI